MTGDSFHFRPTPIQYGRRVQFTGDVEFRP
jgi:hypothetical protein